MTAAAPSIDLSFLSRDIRNQIAHSRDLLAKVEQLQDLANNANDSELKNKLQTIASNLVSIANSIAQNASTTSANAAAVAANGRSST